MLEFIEEVISPEKIGFIYSFNGKISSGIVLSHEASDGKFLHYSDIEFFTTSNSIMMQYKCHWEKNSYFIHRKEVVTDHVAILFEIGNKLALFRFNDKYITDYEIIEEN